MDPINPYLTNVLTSIEIHTMNMNSVTISGDKIQNFITKYCGNYLNVYMKCAP